MLDLDDLLAAHELSGIPTANLPAMPAYSQTVEIASEQLVQLWRDAARSDLSVLILPRAVKRLKDILDNDYAKPSEHIAAIRTVFEYSIGSSRSDDSPDKPLSEMTIGEIDNAIRQLTDIKAKAASLIPIDGRLSPDEMRKK